LYIFLENDPIRIWYIHISLENLNMLKKSSAVPFCTLKICQLPVLSWPGKKGKNPDPARSWKAGSGLSYSGSTTLPAAPRFGYPPWCLKSEVQDDPHLRNAFFDSEKQRKPFQSATKNQAKLRYIINNNFIFVKTCQTCKKFHFTPE
jgi:hypothetical protein